MKKDNIGWTLIILNILGYFGCIMNGIKIPLNIFNIYELFQIIGFNLMLIIGIILVFTSKKKIKSKIVLFDKESEMDLFYDYDELIKLNPNQKRFQNENIDNFKKTNNKNINSLINIIIAVNLILCFISFINTGIIYSIVSLITSSLSLKTDNISKCKIRTLKIIGLLSSFTLSMQLILYMGLKGNLVIIICILSTIVFYLLSIVLPNEPSE